MAQSGGESELLQRIARLQEQLNTPIKSNASAQRVDRGEEQAKEIIDWHILDERVTRLEEGAGYANRLKDFDSRLGSFEQRLDYLEDLRKTYTLRSVIVMGCALAVGITGFTLAILAIIKMF